jgi:general secretion pathway protein G
MLRVPTPAACRGLTLVELLLATALIGVLTAIAVPTYRGSMERTKVARARTELALIHAGVLASRGQDFRLPDSLAAVRGVPLTDPWGRPYAYYYFNKPGANPGLIRKDHNLVPINSEFDLYSAGKNGTSRPPLTAAQSRDDIVVGRDGAFVGIATEF